MGSAAHAFLRQAFLRHTACACAILALSGCGTSEPDANAPVDPVDPVETDTARIDTSDGLIVCEMPNFDGLQGATLVQNFLIMDGAVLRYLSITNEAFALCDPGQPDCSLTLEDGHIIMDHLNNEGIRSQYDVDLASMQIVPRKTRPGEETRIIPFEGDAVCRREPVPEGLIVKP